MTQVNDSWTVSYYRWSGCKCTKTKHEIKIDKETTPTLDDVKQADFKSYQI